MERLSDRWMYYSGLLAMLGVRVDDLKHIQNLIDAEEQGLLLMLTCRPGDEIHFIFDKKIYSGTAVKVVSVRSKTHDFTRVEIEFEIEDPWYNDGRKMKHGANEILGEKAFLTKAEAEKALAEMEKEHD